MESSTSELDVCTSELDMCELYSLKTQAQLGCCSNISPRESMRSSEVQGEIKFLSFLFLQHFLVENCPDFIWDRVKFLPSSWYSAVFWIYGNNVDITNVLVLAKQCLH